MMRPSLIMMPSLTSRPLARVAAAPLVKSTEGL